MGLLTDRLGVRAPSRTSTSAGSRGSQWDADPDESFERMIGFIDRGLRPKGS